MDASTTDYSVADGNGNKAATMLLDCDSVLFYTAFNKNKSENKWAESGIKNAINGTDFLNKDGVFTTIEKKAIAKSTVDSHELTTDSDTGTNVIEWTKKNFINYVALTGEQIFLLDAEDVSNGTYGYNKKVDECESLKKTGSSDGNWWLRSSSNDTGWGFIIGHIKSSGSIAAAFFPDKSYGVSPALNLNLSSVLFSSVLSGTAGETGAEYKLTLLDSDVTVVPGNDVTIDDYTNVITIPYSISGTNSGNATQVSVLILDKEYTEGNTNGASVLAYNKMNVDDFSTNGTGTFTLPDSLSGKKAGTDYHVYIVAEDVNGEKETDYASVPVEIHPREIHTTHVKDEGTRLEPTCEGKGSVTYACTKCDVVIEVVELAATGHKWGAGKVTKEPTETVEGIKTYTCSVCGKTKTEVVPKKAAATPEPPVVTGKATATPKPLKKGSVVVDDKGAAKYEILDTIKKEAAYKKTVKKKGKAVTIPATVKINGVTYKVIKVAANAFKGNKTVTKISIGSNVKTIGKKAFGGCKKLKTLTIKSNKLTSKTVSKNVFKGITKATTLKVPKKKLKAYRKLFKSKGLSSKVKVKVY